ncbi:hypothetical protein [Brevibacillus reuszeri]|uniref:hypothetical protein n=1 Tax=Brevibacillus reuszeri TaxID=54915 RepID=UPI000CCC2CA0|nr:hypothetical protein [Brevibacillus reuszeri]
MAGDRKERSDKKRPVAPYISAGAYEQIARVGYVCDLPLKTIGEMLARESLKSKELLDSIKLNFRRDFIVDEYQYCLGNADNKPFRMTFIGEKKRLAMRFYSFEHEKYAALSYALDCSLQMAVGYVIETAVGRKDILFPVLGKGIIRDLDTKRIEQLRYVCRYLDQRSPDVHLTLPMVMTHIISGSLSNQTKIYKTIDAWSQ